MPSSSSVAPACETRGQTLTPAACSLPAGAPKTFRPLLDLVPDRAAFLVGNDAETADQRLRGGERTGRPLGEARADGHAIRFPG